ncbi:MAG: hypothetical protein AAFR61_15275 [Bacteroidota bacterium]
MKGIALKEVSYKLLSYHPDYQTSSPRTLRRRLAQIRDFAGKDKCQPVTLADVARFFGCSPEEAFPIFFPQKEQKKDRSGQLRPHVAK